MEYINSFQKILSILIWKMDERMNNYDKSKIKRLIIPIMKIKGHNS